MVMPNCDTGCCMVLRCPEVDVLDSSLPGTVLQNISEDPRALEKRSAKKMKKPYSSFLREQWLRLGEADFGSPEVELLGS